MAKVKNNKRSKKNKRDLSGYIQADVPSVGKGQAGFNYVAVPVAKTRNVTTLQPRMGGHGKTFVMKHREYIAEVVASEDFTNTVYPINPGLPGLLAWGSGIAQNYEQYRIRSFSFSYETQAPTTDQGSVMLAIDYDPADTAPANKSQIMAMAGAVRTAVWNRITVSASSARRSFDKLYVRAGGLGENLDIKSYDYGVLNIAIQGATAVGAIGELYADYELELFTPTQDLEVDELFANTANATATPVTLTGIFGSNFAVISGGLGVTASSSSVLHFPKVGHFSLFWTVDAALNPTSADPSVTVASGTAVVSIAESWTNSGSFTKIVSCHAEIAIIEAGAEIAFSLAGCASSASGALAMYIRGANFAVSSPSPVKYSSMVPGQVVRAVKPHQPKPAIVEYPQTSLPCSSPSSSSLPSESDCPCVANDTEFFTKLQSYMASQGLSLIRND